MDDFVYYEEVIETDEYGNVPVSAESHEQAASMESSQASEAPDSDVKESNAVVPGGSQGAKAKVQRLISEQ